MSMPRLAAEAVTRMASSLTDRLFDQTVRAIILEGAAGKPYGAWSRSRANLQGAAAHFNFAGNNPWLVQDAGVYKAMIRAAMQVAKRMEVAEDIVQRVISGETLSSVRGGELYAVGKQIAGELETDPDAALQTAKSFIVRHTTQKALNILRGEKREQARYGPTVQEGEVSDEGIAQQVPSTTMWSGDAGDAFMALLSGPHGSAARTWLTGVWKTKLSDSEASIMQAWLAHPGMNNRQLAQEIGLTDGSYIGKTVKKAIAVAADEMKRRPPSFIQGLELATELEALGYGGYKI
jgi:hypothetical protein